MRNRVCENTLITKTRTLIETSIITINNNNDASHQSSLNLILPDAILDDENERCAYQDPAVLIPIYFGDFLGVSVPKKGGYYIRERHEDARAHVHSGYVILIQLINRGFTSDIRRQWVIGILDLASPETRRPGKTGAPEFRSNVLVQTDI